MKEIKLSQGKVALVDDEDFEYLNQFRWHAMKQGNTFYARKHRNENGLYLKDKMEHILMKRKMIEHEDGNGLNNQRLNLRFCTKQQNQMNQCPHKNTTSKYKGVCWDKSRNKWTVLIQCSGVIYNIGRFKDEIEAATAYDIKAKELFKEFAYLNFKD